MACKEGRGYCDKAKDGGGPFRPQAWILLYGDVYKRQLYYNVLLIYDFAMLSSAFIPLVNRIALYFKFPTVIVLLPMILEQARKQKKYLLIVGILLFMLLSTGYLYFVHGLSGIYPYQSIFE